MKSLKDTLTINEASVRQMSIPEPGNFFEYSYGKDKEYLMILGISRNGAPWHYGFVTEDEIKDFFGTNDGRYKEEAKQSCDKILALKVGESYTNGTDAWFKIK